MKRRIILLSLVSVLFVACQPKTEAIVEEKTECKEAAICICTGNELRIVANLAIKPGTREAMIPIFDTMIKTSRAEEGCVFYDLYEDQQDSTKFVFLEEWKSQEAIDIHNESAHMKSYKEASADKVLSAEVKVIKQILR